ncbi:MAG: hypothetical protein WBM00_04755 [Solirubrobacterales bacterium]
MPAKARYLAITRRAEPAQRAAHLAELRADGIQARLADRRRNAAARIAQLETRHEQEVDDHDERVKTSLGFGLAALVVGLITLAWGWFRASAAVAWLTELSLAQAVGLCVFGGLMLLIIGAALFGSTGVAGALGALFGVLAFALPVVFLLARHSVQIQRARAKPLLKRERLPTWVSTTVAAAMGLVVLIGFGGALSASQPEAVLVSAQLRNRASPLKSGPTAHRLKQAEAEAAVLQATASRLSAKQGAAQRGLTKAHQQLNRAESQLSRAHRDERRYSSQLAALERRETREAERRAREEAEEAEEIEEESSPECDPNYKGACLDPNASDYDCAGGSGDGPYYTGEVIVVGEDHYGLDANGNGIGCEGE